MTKRQIIATGIVVSLLAGGGWIVQSAFSTDESASDTKEARILKVETVLLTQDDSYIRSRHFTGQIVAARSSELSFQSAGQIESFDFDEGQTVSDNKVLARLDTRRLDANRKRIAAELKQAQSVLIELRTGSREEEIRAANAEVKQLQSESILQENRLDRTKRLVERNTSTQDDLDLAQANWDSISARLAAAEARRDEIVAGPRAEKIEAQSAMVDALQAALDEIDVQLEDCVLKAPFAGTLSARLLDPGAVVSAGQPVFRIVESNALEFHVGLPLSAIPSIEQSSTTNLEIDSATYAAEVDRLLPTLNVATRTRTVILKIHESAKLVPGQTGKLLLDETIEQQGFWIPNTALQEGFQGLWSCYVAVPDKTGEATHRVERRDLEVLHVGDNRSYVRGTISAGEYIVTTGLHRLTDHQPVTLDQPTESPEESE